MGTQKIAITVPPNFLKRLDGWAKKANRSRSRFIVEELEKRLAVLEDDKITKMYNDAYDEKEAAVQDQELAEEMLSISAIHEEKEKW
jgi:metal-responsive CopG/Arc/MetJ family transcriptional regulator